MMNMLRSKGSVAEWGGGYFPFNLNGISADRNYAVEEDPFLPELTPGVSGNYNFSSCC
jgi:hypothetical protein